MKLLLISFRYPEPDREDVLGVSRPSRFGGGHEFSGCDRWRMVVRDKMILERRVYDSLGGERWDRWSDPDGILTAAVLRALALRRYETRNLTSPDDVHLDLGTIDWSV